MVKDEIQEVDEIMYNVVGILLYILAVLAFIIYLGNTSNTIPLIFAVLFLMACSATSLIKSLIFIGEHDKE